MRTLKQSLGSYLTVAIQSNRVEDIAEEFKNTEELLKYLVLNNRLNSEISTFEAENEVREILKNKLGMLMLSAQRAEDSGKEDVAERHRKEAEILKKWGNVSNVSNFLKAFALLQR